MVWHGSQRTSPHGGAIGADTGVCVRLADPLFGHRRSLDTSSLWDLGASKSITIFLGQNDFISMLSHFWAFSDSIQRHTFSTYGTHRYSFFFYWCTILCLRYSPTRSLFTPWKRRALRAPFISSISFLPLFFIFYPASVFTGYRGSRRSDAVRSGSTRKMPFGEPPVSIALAGVSRSVAVERRVWSTISEYTRSCFTDEGDFILS